MKVHISYEDEGAVSRLVLFIRHKLDDGARWKSRTPEEKDAHGYRHAYVSTVPPRLCK